MAENAPEHQDRGLFGLFGKKDEHQQEPHGNVEHHGNEPVPVAPGYHHQSGVAAVPVHSAEQGHVDPPKHGHEGGGGVQHYGDTPVPVYSAEHGHVDPPKYGQGHEHGHVDPPKHGHGHEHEGGGGIMSKLHRSDSSSSSSSDEEGEHGKKKKDKKGLKDKLKEKLPGGEKTEEQHRKNEEKNYQAGGGVKKEGFMDKIKDKLPGHKKEGEH